MEGHRGHVHAPQSRRRGRDAKAPLRHRRLQRDRAARHLRSLRLQFETLEKDRSHEVEEKVQIFRSP